MDYSSLPQLPGQHVLITLLVISAVLVATSLMLILTKDRNGKRSHEWGSKHGGSYRIFTIFTSVCALTVVMTTAVLFYHLFFSGH